MIPGGGPHRPRYAGIHEAQEELRQWRLTTPLARFTEIRGKFQQVGIDVFGLRRHLLRRFHRRGDRPLFSDRTHFGCRRDRHESDARPDGAAAGAFAEYGLGAGTATPA